MTTTWLLPALTQATAYPHPCIEPITWRESHISWLFFTGPFVYKVKKAVNFGFLDYTTLERRRAMCEAEIRLNQRLSPGVYLAVTPIRQAQGEIRLEGPGETVEYAVKMRQLPANCWLTDVLARGEATPELLRRIAARLADFHAAAETGQEITQLGGLATMRRNAAENFAQTAPYRGVTISAESYDLIRAYTTAFLEIAAPLIRRREAQGRVRDCHGDLHADHISLEGDAIEFIDCIEFNDRFRYSDVAADLAFLAMDLDFYHRPDLAQALVEAYIERSADTTLRAILDYFKGYRAFVRGKVESFRLDEPDLAASERATIQARAGRYFALARDYAQLSGPLLLAMTGLMGSGKSTLAQALAARLSAEVVTADVVRKELAGLPPDQHQFVAWGTGIYSAESDQHTYLELCRRAADLLAHNRIVILDASFRQAEQRRLAQATAAAATAPFFLIEVNCPVATLRRRLRRRQDAAHSPSDGRLELLDRQIAVFAPPTEIPPEQRICVNAGGALEETIDHALTQLYRRRLCDLFSAEI